MYKQTLRKDGCSKCNLQVIFFNHEGAYRHKALEESTAEIRNKVLHSLSDNLAFWTMDKYHPSEGKFIQTHPRVLFFFIGNLLLLSFKEYNCY